MQLNLNDSKPIFIQIAEGIEDAILTDSFPEESQIPSITEFSVRYKINPATALKGINMLVENGILYKKRGVGMFVAQGAKEKLNQKRHNAFFDSYVKTMLEEAHRLGITNEEIINLIKEKGELL
ncbi:MAG: GntR family transcriptional regulator [Porcipelethomonas sp.]